MDAQPSRRGMIVAVSPEGAIGLHGDLPWKHPGDQARFKRVTLNSVVVMGRKTWESMHGRALPKRRNVVIAAAPIEGVEHYRDIPSALAAVGDALPVWFIGGARIYAEAMPYCDFIDVTYVPDRVEHPEAVRFPAIPESDWEPGPLIEHEDEPGLTRRVYTRRTGRSRR